LGVNQGISLGVGFGQYGGGGSPDASRTSNGKFGVPCRQQAVRFSLLFFVNCVSGKCLPSQITALSTIFTKLLISPFGLSAEEKIFLAHMDKALFWVEKVPSWTTMRDEK
jgi:hypothetical protein